MELLLDTLHTISEAHVAPGAGLEISRKSHRSRVPQPMEADESAHPKQVGLLGTKTVVAVTDSLPHLVEQAD